MLLVTRRRHHITGWRLHRRFPVGVDVRVDKAQYITVRTLRCYIYKNLEPAEVFEAGEEKEKLDAKSRPGWPKEEPTLHWERGKGRVKYGKEIREGKRVH